MFRKSKHRTVYRAGIAYLAVSWLIIQILATLTPILDLPGILVRGFAFMLIGGYPLIMMMAWVYQLTHKTRGWEAHDEPENAEAGSGKIFNIFIFALVALSIGTLLLDIFVLRAVGQ